MFGAKLQGRQNLDLRTAELWTVGLKKMGVTRKEFEKAVEESICMKWPPTCVEDFVALVRGNTNAYPDSQAAFESACKNEGLTADIRQPYSHPVIFETVKRYGSYELKHAKNSDFAKWDKVYQQVCLEHSQGADFTIPESHRIEQKKIAANPDFVDSLLNGLKKKLVGAA